MFDELLPDVGMWLYLPTVLDLFGLVQRYNWLELTAGLTVDVLD